MKTTKTVIAVLMLMVTTGLLVSCTDTELDDGTETAITIENSTLYGTEHKESNNSGGTEPAPPSNDEN